MQFAVDDCQAMDGHSLLALGTGSTLNGFHLNLYSHVHSLSPHEQV